jgi:hypothetical protein
MRTSENDTTGKVQWIAQEAEAIYGTGSSLSGAITSLLLPASPGSVVSSLLAAYAHHRHHDLRRILVGCVLPGSGAADSSSVRSSGVLRSSPTPPCCTLRRSRATRTVELELDDNVVRNIGESENLMVAHT